MVEKDKAEETYILLQTEYPQAKIALNFTNPLELLVATILSAQCTDERVNKVTATLFEKYRTAEDYASADIVELEREVRSTGYFHVKARTLKECCRMLVEKFGSNVPKTMDELVQLPGVARKTANIVLSNAYGIIEGIAVDTHVRRVSQRIGLTKNNDPEKIEKDLMKAFPHEKWYSVNYLLINHGRKVCTAKRPKCNICILNTICASAFTFG